MEHTAQRVLDDRPVKRYAHIFFDLDHTLWDFRANSRATLNELFLELDLPGSGIVDAEDFITVYEGINAALWARYSSGSVDKDVLRVLRFRNTLLQFGVKDDKLARSLGHLYIERCPRRTALVPGALDLLDHLRGRSALHIITNGFQETQHTKLACSGLVDHFDAIVTSERAGARKPDERIFRYALNKAGARAEDSLMIGDDVEADIVGARSAGLHQVLFDPENRHGEVEATHTIAHLSELLPLLG
ncbi:MAG: YjjG family noncanonical pyrimidine nucleotidase [Flavobacteriales bacterium]